MIRLTVNGEVRTAEPAGAESLLTVLREQLGLPGAKNACEQGECGSCTVILDGEPVCSCLVLAADADGTTVRTVEGVAAAGTLTAILLSGSVSETLPGSGRRGSDRLRTSRRPRRARTPRAYGAARR